MNRRNSTLTLCLFAITLSAAAQQNEKYGSPVNFPITLAGNVAEVRSDHFHTGVDIKANEGIGSPVTATADGYVSRVSVSPTGFGKAIYVIHPNGETSVYGHLDRFNKSIDNWIYSRQMAAKSFRVDLSPTPSQFPVKRGEVIGYLGNSGSSGGPHLHFEIRNANGSPINIVEKNIVTPTDKISPNIYSITLYQIDTIQGAPIFTACGSIKIAQNKAGDWELSDTVLRTAKSFYLAYEVIDYKNGSSNTMGIYSLSQAVDGVEQFSFAIDRISFATNRYINSFVQYDLNRSSKYHVIRAYVSANNALSIYRNVKNQGIIDPPTDGGQLQIKTKIQDDAGNSSTVSFSVVFDETVAPQIAMKPSMNKIAWNEEVTVRDSKLNITFPTRSLYDSALLPFSIDHTGVIEVGDEKIPLQKPIKVLVRQDVAQDLQTKAILLGANRKSVTQATYEEGWLTAEIRRMGKFTVSYDTIAPKISAPTLKNSTVTWKVTDDLAGVSSCNLTIDGQWALGEWDPKTSTLSYKIRGSTSEQKERTIVVDASDYKQNKTTKKTKLKW